MTLNLTSFNVRGLRDPSKCTHSNLCVDVTVVQETHFICADECWVLEDEFVVFSAFDSRFSTGVSLLVRRSFNAIVNLIFADDGG